MAEDPAQTGLFDLDDPDIVDSSPESRLKARVAARVPTDAVRWPADGGDPTVLLPVVAQGTYGRVTGFALDRTPITAQGYVITARPLRGGYGGWHPDTAMVVELAEVPDGPVVATVQTDMDGRLTVLTPPDGMPPGEGPPWLRMPVEEQILAARTVLGLKVRVWDGPTNELWAVEGCPEQLDSQVAWWLFGGNHGSWYGRPRPVFSPRRIDEAARAGRLQPNAENPYPSHLRSEADATATPTPRRRGIGHARRQVAAWLAQGLAYQGIADAARQAGTNDGNTTDVHTTDGSTVGADRIDAHLADAAGRALRGDSPPPAIRWRGVAVSFRPKDEQTVHLHLSGGGATHIQIPVPTTWIDDPTSARIRDTIGDHIAAAQARATSLIAAAHELADRIGTPPEQSVAGPLSVPVAESGASAGPVSGAAVAFPRPPHAQTGPGSPPRQSSELPGPQPSPTRGNRR